MTDVFTLLNTFSLDLDMNPEAKEIIEFARNLVDEFYVSLPGEVRSFSEDRQLFLIGSWEDLMVGTEDNLHRYQAETGRSGRQLLSLAFNENLNAERVGAALTFDEDEMRVALMVILVALREIDVKGLKTKSERALAASVARLQALLNYALLAG